MKKITSPDINTLVCAVCGKTVGRTAPEAASWPNYWAYSRRSGFEIAYAVCPQCDAHRKHAFYTVDQISRRLG